MKGPSTDFVLDVKELSKSFGERQVLKHVELSVRPGEFVAILGPSGAGKTTLFKVISGLVEPEQGSILFEGRDLRTLRSRERRAVRRRIGFIFQQFNLIRRVDALSNVLAGRVGSTSTLRVLFRLFSSQDVNLAKRALASVGLANFIWQRTDSLSGGQQQRVAIARALAQRCRLILADEPVASLDPEASRSVLNILRSVAHEHQVGVLCSLHQVQFALSHADRIIGLKAGRIMFDESAAQVGEAMIERLYESPGATDRFRLSG